MRGDLDFEKLVEQYYAPLHRFALSLAGNASDASDLVQQTFYIWASKGHQLDDISRVKSWLFTTLYREFLARERKMTRFPHRELEEAQDELVLPADSMSLAPENLAERVQTTQDRLTKLRAEAEALEREKLQFEELSRKQRDFMQGRTEMAEKLNRSIAMLDRETYEAQKRVEQLLVERHIARNAGGGTGAWTRACRGFRSGT